MTRVCAICSSPFLQEVNKYIKERKFRSIIALHGYMRDKYTIASFPWNYQVMRRHVFHTKSVSRLRQKTIEGQTIRDLETLKLIEGNLKSLQNQLASIETTNLINPRERKETRDIIKTINSTLELLLRYSDKIKEQEPIVDEEEIFHKIVKCLEEFPRDYQTKFVHTWRELEAIKD